VCSRPECGKGVMSISGRRRQRFSTGAILLAMYVGVASASPAAQVVPATAAYDECRVLVQMEAYNKAIQRCEEAVRLDPKSPDPFFELGRVYYFLAQQLPTTTPADVVREHRRKAAENFKKFLALNRGDTEGRRRVTPAALAAVLTLYVFEEQTDEAALEYANRLAEEPSLERHELLLLAKVYSRHARPELSEKSLKRQLEADPSDAEVCQDLAVLYNEPVWNGRSRFDDSIGTFNDARPRAPTILPSTSDWPRSCGTRRTKTRG
jgi:tetratricopeptide (TPR) repeat protein